MKLTKKRSCPVPFCQPGRSSLPDMGGRKKKAVKTNLAKAKANRAAKKKKKAEVEKMADEALRRIEDLPQELGVFDISISHIDYQYIDTF